jgi:hypothetical protein
MCECEFEYGEELEFSDNHDFSNRDIDKFWGYQPKSDHPYCDKLGYRWKYARRPLPRLRDGDWIIILCQDGTELPRRFKRFGDGSNIVCYNYANPELDYVWEDGWKPMKHFNYNHE